MRAGFAAVDITPPAGVELTGFIAREGPSTGRHDPLFARALVFEDGGAWAAVVACDLIGLGRNLVHRVRARVAAARGIPPAAQLFACTHTHGGPETGLLATIARPDPTYLSRLEEALVRVVVAAAAGLQPARLRFGEGQAGVAWNRVHGRLGREWPAAQAVQVVRVEGEAGEAIATVVGYACHAVASGPQRLITADFPGHLVRALEEAGAGPALFVNGAGADLNPASVSHGGRGHAAAEQAGRQLATAALAASRQARPIGARGIAAALRDVELPLLPLAEPEEVAALLDEGAARAAELAPGSWQRRAVEVTHLAFGARLTQLRFGRAQPESVIAEAQVLRIGELALVGLPGESFSALGAAAQAAAGGPAIVAGWANDVPGYLPDRASYALGGYEFDTAHRYYGQPAAFAPEAGERLVEAAAEMLRASPG